MSVSDTVTTLPKKQKQVIVPSPWILDYQDSCLDDIAKLTVASITKHSLSHYYDYHIHLMAFFQDNLGKLAQKGKPFWILLYQEMTGWQ